MLFAGGGTISNLAYAVGHGSVPQFTREYGRIFGMSPTRDVRTTAPGPTRQRELHSRNNRDQDTLPERDLTRAVG